MKSVRLEEIVDIGSSKRIKMSEYVTSGIPFYRSKEIINLHKNQNIQTELFISEERFDEINLKFGSPTEGDILLTSVGTLGVPYQVKKDDKFYFKDGNLTWFRNFSDDVNKRYLYFWLTSPIAKRKFDEITIGSTQKALTIVSLKGIEIDLPSITEQNKIVEVISAIQEKIELNQKMNETLEEIAKTLFKSWFIDFDPVRAKVEKRPTGLSREMSDLFPESFENSELGEIPEGWNIKKISDIFEVKKGSTPATKNTEFWEPKEHIWVSPRDLSQNPYIYLFHTGRGISEVGLQKIRSGLLPENTVMMSSRAPIGLLGISGANVALGTGIFAIPPKKIMSSGLTYFFVDDQIRKLKQLSIGTTFEEVSLKIFNNLMIVFPNDEILIGTKDIFDNLFKKIKNNTLEIKSLINIRDTLLPKLISGELKITDASNLVEEAGI